MLYKTLQFNLPKEIANLCSKSIYTIGEFPESVNGQKYWTSTDEKYALWYCKESNIWIFGNHSNLGNCSGFIAGGPGEVHEVAKVGPKWKKLSASNYPKTKSCFPYEKKNHFTISDSKGWKHITDYNFVLSERKPNSSVIELDVSKVLQISTYFLKSNSS